MLRHLTLLFMLLALLAPAAGAVTFSDQVETTVSTGATIEDYEADAAVLREINRNASTKCAVGKISRKECVALKTAYTDARQSYLETGDRRIAYLMDPTPVNKYEWEDSVDETRLRIEHLKRLAKKHKVGVPK